MNNEMNLKNTETSSPSSTTNTCPYILNGEFYEIISTEGEHGVTVRCCKCPGDTAIYKGSIKSTGNFHMHIKRKHSEFLPRVHEMKLKSFTERKVKIPQKRKPYSPSKQRKKIMQAQKNQQVLQIEPIDYSKNPEIKDNIIRIKTSNTNDAYLGSNTTPTSAQQNYLKQQPAPPAHQVQCIDKNINTLSTSSSVNSKMEIIPSLHSFNQNPIISIGERTSTSVSTTTSTQNQLPIQAVLNPVISIPGQDILLRVENHLKGIEREMRLRNQIESNRIYLDLAKFKYLHPNFNLQN